MRIDGTSDPIDLGEDLLGPVAEVPQAVRAVQLLSLAGHLVGVVVVALSQEPARLGQAVSGFVLVAAGAGLLDLGEDLIGRVLEQAPATGAGLGLRGELGRLLEAVGMEQLTGLLDQCPRVAGRGGLAVVLGHGRRRLAGRAVEVVSGPDVVLTGRLR